MESENAITCNHGSQWDLYFCKLVLGLYFPVLTVDNIFVGSYRILNLVGIFFQSSRKLDPRIEPTKNSNLVQTRILTQIDPIIWCQSKVVLHVRGSCSSVTAPPSRLLPTQLLTTSGGSRRLWSALSTLLIKFYLIPLF